MSEVSDIETPSAPTEFITEAEIEAMRRANVLAGQELLATINKVAETQNYWKAELHEMLRQEAEEDERARGLFREVMINEAEAMTNPKFLMWLADREKFGVGREAITTWYENENLLMLCPYLAVVPYPRLLTDEGKTFVASTIDELSIGEFVIETHPANADFCGRDFAAERMQGESRLKILRNGAEAIQAIGADVALRAALEETGCLFLNDVVSAVRPEGVFFAQAFVVRGRIVAIQLSTDVPPQRAEVVGAAVEMFYIQSLSKHMPHRSFVFIAQIDCAVPTEKPPVFLLNIGILDVQAHGRFAWTDLMGAVMAGGDESGRPIVRTASVAPANVGESSAVQRRNENVALPPAPPSAIGVSKSAAQEAVGAGVVATHADPTPQSAAPSIDGAAPGPIAAAAAAPQGHSTSTLVAVAALSAVAAVGASVFLNRRK